MRLLFVLLVCLYSASSSASELEKVLTDLIDAHEGKVGVVVKNLKTGESFRHNANVPMPTASLIKLPVMIEAYRQIGKGTIHLDDKIKLTEDDKVPGSGILTRHFSAGTQISLRDAIRLMIVYSDNTATNLVIDKIGLPSTAVTMEKLGCPNTKLHAKVFRGSTTIFPERSREFGLGSTTAAEMASLLERIARHEVLDPESCHAMLDHLYACDDKSKIPRLLPKGVKVAHKTGAVSKSRTDAGLIDSSGGQIAICILTTDNTDRSWESENAANLLCANIAKAAYDYFNPSKKDPSSKPPALAIGEMSELVESLQRTLNAKLDPSPDLAIDGDFGPITEGAVKAFQELSNLRPSGIVDAQTWKALGPLITQDPPVPSPDVINSEVLEKLPADALEGPPHVTSKAWVVVNAKTGEQLAGLNPELRLHPASTTKIMTAHVVLRLVNKDPAAGDERVTFSKAADDTIGSTSAIRAGESVTVRELLYGLMLPSGNDASVALGEHFGKQLLKDEGKSSGLEAFIERMNDTARELGMKSTNYENTHGLTQEGHLTSAADLAILAREAMTDPFFRQLVTTRQFGCVAQGEPGYSRNVLWKNTNRLLGIEGYDGVKTGTTDAAGACLVSQATRNGESLIVVVLGATSTDARYTDTRNLYRWAWRDLIAAD